MGMSSVARAYHRGHPIHWDGKQWVFDDNGNTTVNFGGEDRPCKRCGQLWGKTYGWDGHVPDPCLGLLPGVSEACCGHGIPGESYIVFNNGTRIRGTFDVTERTDPKREAP